jgi:hypothetical protein
LLAVVVTERGGNIRVVTGYDLDAGQRGLRGSTPIVKMP